MDSARRDNGSYPQSAPRLSLGLSLRGLYWVGPTNVAGPDERGWARGTAGKEKASGTDWFRRLFQGWQMRDSNPRRRCQLIYSQPPLAARVICRTSKEDHSRFPVPERPVSSPFRFQHPRARQLYRTSAEESNRRFSGPKKGQNAGKFRPLRECARPALPRIVPPAPG